MSNFKSRLLTYGFAVYVFSAIMAWPIFFIWLLCNRYA